MVVGSERRGPLTAPHAKTVATVLICVGLLYLIGSIVDLIILWGLQRQAGPNWVFVATGNTLDAIPRFGLAFALMYAGLWFRATRGAGLYRVLGLALVVVALAAGALVALLVMNYQTLMDAGVPSELARMLTASATKGAAIGSVAAVLYLVAGAASVRLARA